MRIATWNINGVRRHQERLLDWLRVRKPDLVALQKINAEERDFPSGELMDAGYYAVVHGSPPEPRNNYGVAILSRREPRVVQQGLPGQDGLGPRLLTVDVDGLEFSSVYAPYELESSKRRSSGRSKLAWFESLTEHLTATRPESGRRVKCGDFNVVPVNRYGPKRRLRTPNYDKDVQARFGTMLKEAGLADLYAAPPSGWSDRFMYEGREGWVKFGRLEYVLGTQNMVDLNPVVRFDIDHAVDHNPRFHYWVRAPIIADFNVQSTLGLGCE